MGITKSAKISNTVVEAGFLEMYWKYRTVRMNGVQQISCDPTIRARRFFDYQLIGEVAAESKDRNST